jgi:outer membrane protein assembly factor BamA
MYLGVLYQVRNAVMVDRAEDGRLGGGGVPGSDGGMVSGAGVVGMWDTRDNILFPTSGSFHTASIFRSGGALGGDFQMTRYSVDLRRYLSVRGHVLGFQAYLRSVAGDVPFDMLPRLGGQNIMRGTFQGRYRDRHLLAAQTEYRALIWRRLGLAAFAGAGQVAPELDAISRSDLHYSLGLGFRLMIDPRERMNLRIDLGYGRDGASGVYITVGESF